MSKFTLICIIIFPFFSCEFQEAYKNAGKPKIKVSTPVIHLSYPDSLKKLFSQNPDFISNGFDFPVGIPDAKKYYNAQPFGRNSHLGDDWNGTGGGNSDLGDPVFSIGNGWVSEATDFGSGWGNVVRVVHYLENHSELQFVESLYAHLDEIKIEKGTFIKKAQQLGTIGNANGAYWAHLHFEIRADIEMGIGGGYSTEIEGYLNPTEFIKTNR